ncbi:MAG: hypothetical protein KDA85_01570, partial [Planctomycetaceae bacterium]|nr:hypothetical protein [Planctomycetaceae bacterium]
RRDLILLRFRQKKKPAEVSRSLMREKDHALPPSARECRTQRGEAGVSRIVIDTFVRTHRLPFIWVGEGPKLWSGEHKGLVACDFSNWQRIIASGSRPRTLWGLDGR